METKLWNTALIMILALVVKAGAQILHYPPLMKKQPPSKEILFQVNQESDENDKPCIIECEAEGGPPPKYKWTKNGKEFDWEMYDGRIAQQPGRGTLVIQIPRSEDIGQYQCFAYNEWGVATSNSVWVRQAEINSFKEVSPVVIKAKEGQPFKLTCNPPDGRPEPNVKWMKENQLGALEKINSSRITVGPEGSLFFTTITKADQSIQFYYTCIAYLPFSNEYKKGNRIYLKVSPSISYTGSSNKHPPSLQYASSLDFVRSDTVDLWCIVGGDPLPEIRWSKQGSELPNGRFEYDNFGRTLKIQDLVFGDEGSYVCNASNGVGSPISHSIRFTVRPSVIRMSIEPESINAVPGETVEFRCEAVGFNFTPKIQWIHNGKHLEEAPPNPRRKRIENNIIIEHTTVKDIGNYGCNASYDLLGYVYKDVSLNVLALPARITEKPRDEITIERKSLILTCRVFGIPKPVVYWRKDGNLIGSGGRRSRLDNGDLQIRDVYFNDDGEFTCLAINKYGNDTAKSYIIVKEPTRIVKKPEDCKVANGNSATFHCSAVADSLFITIDWLAEGKPINFGTESRYYISRQDFSLTISKATELDSGVYTCIASTGYDNDTASATLTVQDIPNRPELTGVVCGDRDATIMWKAMGDNLSPIIHYTIQYNTDSNSAPYAWEETYEEIPATENNYTIPLSPLANYIFRVIATNEIGPSPPSLSSDACLCNEPPDVPFKNPDNVKGHGTTPKNLVISWTPMAEIHHNAPNFTYQVEWKTNVEDEEWNFEYVTQWRQSELVLENQPTYRPYLIRVRAINEIGECDTTPTEVLGYSGQDVPLEAPGNFVLMNILDGGSAMVAWDPVKPESIRGKLEGYKIHTWTDEDFDNEKREIIVSAPHTKTLVQNLIPYTNNYLTVQVYQTYHNGPSSTILEIQTPQGTPGPVEDLESFPLSKDSLYIKWTMPERSNGLVLGYNIYYQKMLANSGHGDTFNAINVGPMISREPFITDPNQLSVKVTGLVAGTKYRLHILARTEVGTGEDKFVEERTFVSPAVILNKPRFRWKQGPIENGSASIRVEWLPNFKGSNRPGSHFYVQYKKQNETQFLTTKPELYEEHLSVTGLDPGDKYIFRVVSVDGKLSKKSDSKIVSTYSHKNL